MAAAKPRKIHQTCSKLVLHFRTPLKEQTLMHTPTLSHESWEGINHYEQTTPSGNRMLPDIYLLKLSASILEHLR